MVRNRGLGVDAGRLGDLDYRQRTRTLSLHLGGNTVEADAAGDAGTGLARAFRHWQRWSRATGAGRPAPRSHGAGAREHEGTRSFLARLLVSGRPFGGRQDAAV